MADDSVLSASNALFRWVVDNVPALAERRASLTPRLEMEARAMIDSYDVFVRFFVEDPRLVPLRVLPDEYLAVLADLAESPARARGFATVAPARPGSSVMEFKNFVWNEYITF